MTRNRAWYVQLAFGFLAMLASLGLVDRYITPAVAAIPSVDSTSDGSKDMKVVTLKAPSKSRKPLVAPMREEPGQVEQKLSAYWIGVRCHAPLPPMFRSHVKLPEGQGLLVLDVVEKGPGQKAGLKQYDVLINIGKKPLRSVQDLIKTVEASQGKPFEVGLLREGKPISLTVDPEKRPEGTGRPALPPKIQHLLQEVQPQEGYQPQMRLRFFHPGTVVPPNTSIYSLPKGLSISIFRSGTKPAVIKVERDGKKWDVTENELNKLPEDIRAHVDRMLNGTVTGAMPQFDFMPSLGPNRPLPFSKNQKKMEKQWQEQIRRMQEQVRQMEQLMEQMRQR